MLPPIIVPIDFLSYCYCVLEMASGEFTLGIVDGPISSINPLPILSSPIVIECRWWNVWLSMGVCALTPETKCGFDGLFSDGNLSGDCRDCLVSWLEVESNAFLKKCGGSCPDGVDCVVLENP